MTSRQRLIATLRGERVDRPAVSFYEVGGFIVDPGDTDEFNVYNSESWKPLIDLAENRTDLIRMMSPVRSASHISWDHAVRNEIGPGNIKLENWETENSRFTRVTYTIGSRELTSVNRRDKDRDTVWATEPLLKDRRDVLTYLDLPDEIFSEEIDLAPLREQEESLGDRGIVMVDTEDPVCAVAGLFRMEDFITLAYSEIPLCHRLLARHAARITKRTERVSEEFPGRLWRIYGPEYAAPPFFPTRFFEEYVVRYDEPMIDIIHENGGFARVHAHGRVKEIMPFIAAMNADAVDPLEPPGQGDLELGEAREKYGDRLVLFGNIEVADIENMPQDRFRARVKKSIREGTAGSGRGFVLMPSASPFGREISCRTLENYIIMIEEIEKLS